jgi:hypothetical protein
LHPGKRGPSLTQGPHGPALQRSLEAEDFTGQAGLAGGARDDARNSCSPYLRRPRVVAIDSLALAPDNFRVSQRSAGPKVPFQSDPHVKPEAPANKAHAAREALRKRIDAELAELGTIKISSWMLAEPPTATPTLDDGREPASEVELDAALGALLWRAREQLQTSHSFHVIGPDGALVAVLMPQSGTLSVRPLVAQDELDALELHRRPQAAGKSPPDYRQTDTATVLWRFALFGEPASEALPPHYRQMPLRLNQMPPLDRTMVAGRHYKLMRLLHERSHTFDELRALTGLSEKQLHRDLTALYLVGSLGTN